MDAIIKHPAEAVDVECDSAEEDGSHSRRCSQTVSCSAVEGTLTDDDGDDPRWSSAHEDGDASSIDDKTEVASRDDDGERGSKDDGECSSKDDSSDSSRRSSVDEEAPPPPPPPAEDVDEGGGADDDLEGHEKSRTPPDGGAKAWLVACGAFTALICTFGYLNTFGVFQSYYQRHLLAHCWPSQIAWIGSTQVFLLFLGGLMSGPLADRYGFRAVFLPSAIVLVTAVMLSSVCTTYPGLLITHGIVFGFASGMIFTPTVSVVGQYFTSKRALATGIAVSGASVGGIVFPLMLDYLLNATSLGFGTSVRIIGGVMIALLAFTGAVIREFAPRRKRKLFLPRAFYDSAYLLSLLGFFFTLLGFWTPIFYIVEYAQAQGVDVVSAFYLVAIMNATTFLGRIILSFVADRIGHFNANAAFTACTSVLIFTWTTAQTKTAITIWITVYGFFQGAVILLISPCLAQVCPRLSDIGTYVGMALACGSIGGLLDTPINGMLISRFGYFHASIFSGVLVLAGAICYTLARLRIDQRLLAKV